MSEKSNKLTKVGIIATVLVGLVTAGVTLYTHFDSQALVAEPTISKGAEPTDENKSANVSIKEVLLTPVDFEIPSSFYLELENGGLLVARDIQVVIDFGESKVETCAFRPNDKSNMEVNGDEYVVKIDIKELMKNESFYVNCLTSSPMFKKILVGGGNIGIDKELTWTSYKEQRSGGELSGWRLLLSMFGTVSFPVKATVQN